MKNWKLVMTRLREEQRGKQVRTVSTYQVWHGTKKAELSGYCVEPGGPGDNAHSGNDRRVEAGTYKLATHDGEKYKTIGYAGGRAHPRPALELVGTGKRVAILFHPGVGFLSSIGCINPTRQLPGAGDNLDYADSRNRVLKVLDDARSYLGHDFPSENGHPIPGATISIVGEP